MYISFMLTTLKYTRFYQAGGTNMSTVFCRSCAKAVHGTAETRPACCAPQMQAGDKNIVVTGLLAFYTGTLTRP